jgi:hypothetical protein
VTTEQFRTAISTAVMAAKGSLGATVILRFQDTYVSNKISYHYHPPLYTQNRLPEHRFMYNKMFSGPQTTNDGNSGPLTSYTFSYSGSPYDINEDYVAVGDQFSKYGSSIFSGAVIIYNRKTGAVVRTIFGSPSEYTFGYGVAFCGNDLIAIGAGFNSGGTGKVYIYYISTGALYHSFTSTGCLSGGFFGSFMKSDGTTLLIGAHNNNSGRGGYTHFNIASKTGTTLNTDIGTTVDTSDQIGYSVAIDPLGSGWSAVGAPGAYTNGVVAVFFNGVRQYTLYNPGDTTATLSYGHDIDIYGEKLVVSGYYNTNSNTGAIYNGMVYVYNVTNGSLLHTINPQYNGTYRYFGSGVSITQDSIFVSEKVNNRIIIEYDANTYNYKGRVYPISYDLSSYKYHLFNRVRACPDTGVLATLMEFSDATGMTATAVSVGEPVALPEISEGDVITQEHFNEVDTYINFFTTMMMHFGVDAINDVRYKNIVQVDFTTCHSSCHSSCHNNCF